MRRLPPASFFVPSRLQERRWRAATRTRARQASTLHLTHADCLDGAACDALVRMRLGEGVRTVWLDPADTLSALEAVALEGGRGKRLLVSDLSLQKGQGEAGARALAKLAQAGWRIEWRDHHAKQWDPEDPPRLAAHAAIEVDFAGKECGATLVQRALLPEDAFAIQLAAVVRDHDLWLLKDPRSIRLKDAAVALGGEAFVARLLAARRLDDAALERAADEETARKAYEVEEGAKSATFLARGQARIGLVYGDVPTNEVLHELLTNQGCLAAALFKPSGGFSLRSRKGTDVCHAVAQHFGGGGHPNAAGGKLRLPAWRMPGYWARGTEDPAARAVASALLDAVAGIAAR